MRLLSAIRTMQRIPGLILSTYREEIGSAALKRQVNHPVNLYPTIRFGLATWSIPSLTPLEPTVFRLVGASPIAVVMVKRGPASVNVTPTEVVLDAGNRTAAPSPSPYPRRSWPTPGARPWTPPLWPSPSRDY